MYTLIAVVLIVIAGSYLPRIPFFNKGPWWMSPPFVVAMLILDVLCFGWWHTGSFWILP